MPDDKNLITAETVAAAAEAIASRGGKPSVRKIRDELGGGSPNLILPLLNAWRDTQKKDAPASMTAEPDESVDLPAEAVQVLDKLSRHIADVFSQLLQVERTRAAAVQQAIQLDAEQRVAQAQEFVAQRIGDLEARAAAKLAEAREEAQSLAEQLAVTEAERDNLRLRLQEAEERAKTADADRRRSAELHSEQMRQIEGAHKAIDNERREQLIRLEAKLTTSQQEVRALKERVSGLAAGQIKKASERAQKAASAAKSPAKGRTDKP